MLPFQYIPYRRSRFIPPTSTSGEYPVSDLDDWASWFESYWALEGVLDTKGSNNWGVNGFPEFIEGGKYEDCLDSVQLAIYLKQFPAPAGLKPTNGFAISTWFKHEGTNEAWDVYLLGYSGGTVRFRLYFDNFTDKVGVDMRNTVPTLYNIEMSTALDAEVWHHVVALAYQDTPNNKLRLYVNGALIGSVDWTGTLLNQGNEIRLGGGYNQHDETAFWLDPEFDDTDHADDFAAALWNDGDGIFWRLTGTPPTYKWVEVL